MHGKVDYFLRKWTVRDDVTYNNKPSPDSPERVVKEATFCFHEHPNKGIYCVTGGKLQQDARDEWQPAGFVYDAKHHRLLGMIVIKGQPFVLEVNAWKTPDGKDGVLCGYVAHHHVQKERPDGKTTHNGWWHGDN